MSNLYLKFLELLISIVDKSNKNLIIKFLKNKTLNKRIVAFDVGAHKGETLEIFLKSFNIEQIFCFEPNRKIYERLKNKIKMMNYKNVFLFNYGLGSKIETRSLKTFLDTSSSTFSQIDSKSNYYLRKKKIFNLFSNKFFSEDIEVEVSTLSKFIEENNIKKIDILKIDTEGFEYKILKGIADNQFKDIELIYFEHHYDLMLKKDYKFSDINKLLTYHNFEMVFKIKMKFRKTFEYIYELKKK